MATTEEYKNGGSASYSFSIEYIKPEDIKVKVDGTALTYTATNPPAQTTEYTVNGSNVIFKQASVSGSTNGGVRIYRQTELGNSDSVTFQPGSAIRASDLNANHKLVKFSAQEKNDQKVTEDDIIDGAVTSAKIRDNTIVNADINASAAIDNSKIADGLLKSGITVNSANIVDGSIVDADVNASANIQGSKLANDSVALTKLGGGTLPSDITVTSTNIQNGTIVDADIQTGTLDNRYYTETELNNGQLDNQYYTESELNAGQLDTRYYTETELDNGVLDPRYYTETELNSGQLNNLYYTETELDGGQLDNRYFTETESDARYFRQDSTETISSGDTWSGSDAKIATTGAIDLRVIDLIDDVGGFVPILHETYFPSNNPDINNGTGTIVSIQSASTDLVPSGTTVTVANGAGSGQAVIITNVPETIPSGYGFLVETTTTTHTYTFHRLVPKATEVSTIAANAVNIAAAGANVTDIHNFADLYQISTSAPINRADGSNLVAGDLWYDSSSNKVLMIYDGSSGDGFTAATPNASDLANIAIVAGQITFTEDLGLITNALTTQTGNTTLNTVAGIATEAATVAGIASDITAVAADATDIGAVAGKATEIGRLGTADAVADMNILGTTAIVSDMDTLADISSDITTVAGISSNVTAVANNATNINAVNANSTNINAVNSNSSNINTVSGINADVTTVAGISSNVTAVAGNASNINAAVGNATNITTVAGNDANITAVANNSSNINSAVSNASNINSAVSNASNINSAVSNATNINIVAGVSSNVTTVAGSIANVNTAATNIANINTTATNIADVNTFANRYRIDSSDPGTNNDEGDLYFNTTSNELRVYNGSTWQGGVTATGNLAGLGANTFTGAQTFASGQTFDGRDVSADGAKLDAITTSSGAILNGVTATTQSASDNSTKIATTAYTDTAISNLVDSSPSALNTLNELAAALGDDANFSTTITNSLATKLATNGDGSNVTNLNASNIASGTLAAARLPNHSASLLTSGTIPAARVPTLNQNTTGSSGSCTGNAATASNAALLDNIDSSQFVRSDQADTLNGYYTINTTENQKLLLSGSDNPNIRWQQGTTNKAFIQWNDHYNALRLKNEEDNSELLIRDDIEFTQDGSTFYNVWHAGNDGSGSGLDADTVDGIQASSFIRSDAADVATGQYDFQYTGSYPIVIGSTSGSHDAHLLLRGSSNPYIRFRENNTDKAYIQWNAGGYLELYNEEHSRSLRIKNGESGLIWNVGGTERTVYHSGNIPTYMGKASNGSHWNVNHWLEMSSSHGLYYPNNFDYHIYLDGQYLRIRNNASSNGMQIYANGGTRGYVYANDSNQIGFLDQGGSWSLRTERDANTCTLMDQHFNSDTHETYDLGTTSARWKSVHAKYLHFGSGSRYFGPVGGNYGTVGVYGSGAGAYEGYSIDDRAVFMHDGASSTGIYDDVNNQWLFQGTHGGSSYMYNNGTWRVQATSSGANINGPLTVGTINYSDIYMVDTDETTRRIHCNSHRIGFLNSSNGWGAYCDNSGNWVAGGNVTAYSDERLKTNVNTIDNALDIVDQLRGVSFEWKKSGEHSIGVIAQEVEKVLPELVVTGEAKNPETEEIEEVKSVDYGKITGVLINAIKELRAEVAELKRGK